MINNCPYCGRPAVSTLRGGGWTVDCTYHPLEYMMNPDGLKPCDLWPNACMEMHPTEEEAIADWNAWTSNNLTLGAMDALEDAIQEMKNCLNASQLNPAPDGAFEFWDNPADDIWNNIPGGGSG